MIRIRTIIIYLTIKGKTRRYSMSSFAHQETKMKTERNKLSTSRNIFISYLAGERNSPWQVNGGREKTHLRQG